METEGVITDIGRKPEENSSLKCRSECVQGLVPNRCGWRTEKRLIMNLAVRKLLMTLEKTVSMN